MENTSNKQIFDPRSLEKLLVKDWVEFINPRNLLNFLKDNAKSRFNISDPKIQTLLVSNCELKPQGLFLWINYNIVNSKNSVNLTEEIFLDPTGSIRITKTI